MEVSKDYKKLEIKSKNLKNNFKLFKKIDLQSKYFSSGDIYNKILDYLFDKKGITFAMELPLENQTYY